MALSSACVMVVNRLLLSYHVAGGVQSTSCLSDCFSRQPRNSHDGIDMGWRAALKMAESPVPISSLLFFITVR